MLAKNNSCQGRKYADIYFSSSRVTNEGALVDCGACLKLMGRLCTLGEGTLGLVQTLKSKIINHIVLNSNYFEKEKVFHAGWMHLRTLALRCGDGRRSADDA